MKPETPAMKIGDAARKLGLSVQTLRFYEREGLLSTGRSPGGTRQYTADDLERLRAIRGLAQLNIPLDVLQALAATRSQSASGDQACRSVDARLADIGDRLHELRNRIDATLADIDRARSLVNQCVGCPVRPTRNNCAPCPVSDGLDQAQILQLIWDQDHDT